MNHPSTLSPVSLTSWQESVRTSLAGRRVLLVVDGVVDRLFDVYRDVKSFFPSQPVSRFSDFAPNPNWNALTQAMTVAHEMKADALLAIGGGTAMDLAKLTAAAMELGGCEALWTHYQQGLLSEQTRPATPLLAIPTTAGTGAEVTPFAVLYRDGVKHSIAGPALKPDHAILDPLFLSQLPPAIIADTGLDAACQAMESLWSNRTSSESEGFAWAALKLAATDLMPAVQRQNPASLAQMLIASHRAGQAISLTTTTAPHALSYGLTSYLDIPHGQAVATLFGPIFAATGDMPTETCRHPHGTRFLATRLDEIAAVWGQTAAEFPVWWRQFLSEDLHVPSQPLSIPPALVEQLASNVNPDRLVNHPRTFAPNEIAALYHGL